MKAIDRFPLSCSPWPDGIGTKLLKMTVHTSAALLTLIFQQSLDSSSIPDDWKNTLIKPVLKGGHNTNPSNFRPISPVCCKILEHLIFTQVMAHLNANNLLL